MRSLLSWLVLLTGAVMLIILGFTGRLGSFLAAFVAPGALVAGGGSSTDPGADGGPKKGGHCAPDGQTVETSDGFYICQNGIWDGPVKSA
jgi:hypothetical protein